MGLEEEAALKLSVGLNQLAAERVSATNYAGGIEAASQAITSALLGEREALKGLGIAISEADLKQFAADQGLVWSQTTKAQQAQLTYELILKKSANSIGDVAKSVGTYAYETRRLDNAWENALTSMGTTATPIVAAIKGQLASLLQSFADTQKQINEFSAKTAEGAKLRAAAALLARDKIEQITGKNSALYQAANEAFITFTAQYKYLSALPPPKPLEKPKAGATGGAPLTGTGTKEEVEEVVAEYEQGLSIFEQMTRAASDFERTMNGNKSATDQWAESLKKVELATNAINGLLSAGAQLTSAIYTKRIQENDDEMNRELERKGLLEADDVAKAEQELAKAKANGDAERIRLAQLALDKSKIEEKYAKKRRQLEYEGAMASWGFQLASATAALPLMIMNAWNSGIQAGPFAGLPLAGIMAGLAATTGAIQLAAIGVAKPTKPKFEAGGIVPGDSFYGDQVAAQLNSGEMVLNQRQQAQLFAQANGGTGGMMRVAPIQKETLLDVLFRASQNGELFISERAVVSR